MLKSILFLSFSVMFFAVTSNAKTSTKYDYKKYWSQHKVNNPDGSIKFFIKRSPLSGIDGIATVSVTEKNTLSKEEVFSVIKKSIDGATWSEEKIDKLDFIETVDKESSTLYRLGYNEKTKQFSFASVRLRNLLPSYLEVHLMQTEQLTGKASKKSAQWLYELLISRAYADALADKVQDYIVTTGQGILAPTNASIDGLGNSISTGAQGVSTSIDNFGNRMDSSTARIGDSVDRVNSTFKTTLSAQNVAKLAAVGAFTSTLTSALTTFAINGTWEAAKKIYYEVVGDFNPKEKKQRIELFEKSFKEFSEVSPKLVDLNKRLDIFSSVLNSLSKEGSTEPILAQLDADIKRAKTVRTEAGSICTSPDCLGQEAMLEIKALEDVRKVVAAAGGDVRLKRGEICSYLDSLYMAYVDAELKVTSARRHIIQTTPVFMGAVSQISSVDEAMQESRKTANACLDPINSQIRSLSSAASKEQCDLPQNATRTTCMRWSSLQRQKSSCIASADIMVSDDLKASLADSAANFNEQVGNFSRLLGTLDCSKSANGTCVEPGPYREGKQQVQSKLTLASRECTSSTFAKSFKKYDVPAAAPAATAGRSTASDAVSGGPASASVPTAIPAADRTADVSGQETQSLTFFGKIKKFFKDNANRPVDEANRYHQDLYGGGG